MRIAFALYQNDVEVRQPGASAEAPAVSLQGVRGAVRGRPSHSDGGRALPHEPPNAATL
jgi:hypothetical protein